MGIEIRGNGLRNNRAFTLGSMGVNDKHDVVHELIMKQETEWLKIFAFRNYLFFHGMPFALRKQRFPANCNNAGKTIDCPIMNREKKLFYTRLLTLALPIMGQNLLSSSLSFLDTLMIGQIGTNEIAAVGIANQIFFLLNLFAFGIASGAAIFFSQYYGAGNHEKMEKVMAIGLIIAFIGSSLWAAASICLPRQIMYIFTHEEAVVSQGVVYQQIVGTSYIFFAISSLFCIGFRAITKAHLPLISSIASLTANAILNYLLIFGIGPFPRMGVAGAAWATLFSRGLELVILICLAFHIKAPFLIKSRQAFALKKDFVILYFKTCLPVLCNECLWSLGMTVYKIAISAMGVGALAAINVSDSVSNFFFIAAIGFANGGTVLIGNTIGRGELDKAQKDAKNLISISLLTGIAMGILMAITATPVSHWFNIEPAIRYMAITSLWAMSIYQPLKTLNTSILVGILRGAGDTQFGLFGEIGCVWLIGVPFAFLSVQFLHLPLWGVYLLINFEEIGKTVVFTLRMRSGKWLKALAK